MKKTLMDYRDFYRRELLEDVMPFWMRSDLLDREYGGCITSVDRAGRSYNDDKSVWFQGRCLWTFSALCRQYGEQKAWREGAELARRFLEGHCVDTDGRMFFQTTRDGRPLRKRRYLFSESFYVVGMAEYAAAFGDAGALDKAEACFDLMLRLYREPSSDPYKITPKTYASTREEHSAAVPMVLLAAPRCCGGAIPAKRRITKGSPGRLRMTCCASTISPRCAACWKQSCRMAPIWTIQPGAPSIRAIPVKMPGF